MFKKLVFGVMVLLLSLSSLTGLAFADTANTDTNLIANPSMETSSNGTTPDDWQTGGWGTNNAAFTYVTNSGYDGNSSVRTDITSYTNGDAKWYFTPVAVQPNTTYTFSDYYESTATTDVELQNNGTTFQDLGTVAASSTWQQASFTFTTSATTTNLTVFHLLDSVGSLSIDDASLAAVPSVPPVAGNMVPNPSAETSDPTNAQMPLDWTEDSWGSNTNSFDYSTDAHSGARSLSVSISSYDESDPNAGDAKWVFTPQAVTQDTQYTYSDYYEATTATEVDAAFTMSDGSILYQIIGLPDPAASWTQFSTTFTVPLGAVNVTIYHLIHSVGTLTIDDAYMAPYTPVGFNRALVSLTFDDGYDNEYTEGLPLLQKYGFNSTQFIITDDVNQTGYLTTAQVQELAQSGQEIASHTVTHNDLLTETAGNTTTPGTYDYEFAQSQATLEQWLGGTPVTDVAYPNGLYNSGITNEAEQFYAGARGVEDGLNSKDNFNPYDIKVQNVYDTTTTAQVADWVAQAQETNTWLVIVYHSVDPTGADGSIYNVTPTQLDAQLSAIQSSGVKVETMAQALAEVEGQINPAPTPPTVSNVTTTATTTSGTTVGWTTDQASTSQVEYGTSTSYGSETTLDSTQVTTHSVTLSGLTANTPYHYRVISTNAAGATTTSQDYTFTTSAAPSIPGDVNGDSTVDALDLSIILTNWGKPGQTHAQGDLNGDGNVDALDLSIVLTNWSN